MDGRLRYLFRLREPCELRLGLVIELITQKCLQANYVISIVMLAISYTVYRFGVKQ